MLLSREQIVEVICTVRPALAWIELRIPVISALRRVRRGRVPRRLRASPPRLAPAELRCQRNQGEIKLVRSRLHLCDPLPNSAVSPASRGVADLAAGCVGCGMSNFLVRRLAVSKAPYQRNSAIPVP